MGLFNDTYVIVFFPDFLYKSICDNICCGTHMNCLDVYKSICCWYSFELSRLVEAIQIRINNTL